ncbi:MAG: FecR domain-containing protein [Pseudomonadota bacterium]
MTESQAPLEDSLNQQARAWISRLVSGEATVADLEAAQSWRAQSALHEAAFTEAARLWERLEPAGLNVLKRSGAAMPDRASRPFDRRMFLGAGGVALASTAAYLIVVPPFNLWPSLSELRADYRTRTGEQRRIETTDGVSVEMNTATSLNLRTLAKGHVRIELISGEAAIATASGGTGSILVIAGDSRVSAANAKFNVRLEGASACVSCLDGSVHVEAGAHVLDLKAEQQVSNAGHSLGAPLVIDPAVVSAWQSGLLIFHGAPLVDVVAEINRYRPGRIILLNAELGRQPVNARFHIARTDEIVTLVERVFGARVERLPGGLVFLS